MGKRGPKPKPTRAKELAGNPGKRPLNDREPRPERGAPTCPGWLSKEARAEWRRVCPELDRLGLLCRKVDRAALAAYCQAYAELEYATALLNTEGRIVKEPITSTSRVTGETSVVGQRLKAHPAVKLQRDAFARVKSFLSEFGLTPASRVNLRTPDAPIQDDPFEKLLAGIPIEN